MRLIALGFMRGTLKLLAAKLYDTIMSEVKKIHLILKSQFPRK